MSEPRDVAEAPGAETEIRWFGLVLLVGHLALTVIGAVALWRIAGGWWLGAAAAALFALGYILLWRYLLAPGSRQRLGYRERLTIALVVGPAVLVLGGLANLWLLALIATSVLILGDALNERSAS
ncbi:MAG: hypothetical protein IPJ61_12195 [Tessaracoccus sp.]|uniref:hypothetical protein n=1 Tax=Tessaracoccus sp. TaxID=1971211 RepID=UPI001EB72869|nr:hypothetical protein [Tessaracoccus sp.]MBK7821803.1 hypothetical protein [Tessaracoccus sp.]